MTELQLSKSETEITKTFRTLCKIDKKATWSSDDFRRYGLDRFLFGKKQGAVGGYFRKLLVQKLIVEVGRVRSVIPANHFREIRLFKWTT